MLGFQEWFEIHEQELTCKAAETGADRETGFDVEWFTEQEYGKYVDEQLKQEMRK